MTHHESTHMNTIEREQQATVIELLAPHGLGFGSGGISVKTQLETGILTPEAPAIIHETIMNDPALFKAVEVTDDGCGDGRPWKKIIQAINSDDTTELRSYKRSLLRAKVFGGGLVTGASMLRTILGEPGESDSVGGDRSVITEHYAARGFAHGAHIDDHAANGKCGCGAIDQYPGITANALYYRKQITDTLKVIYGDDFANNERAIADAFAVYESLVASSSYFRDAGGALSMGRILSSGAVVKELYGHHVEDAIILNDAPGTTLDQQYYTTTIKEACVEKPETVQAFTVDLWRGREIAEIVTAIACEEQPSLDVTETYNLAVADFYIRTLAVAGTLTAGDLPVYLHRIA